VSEDFINAAINEINEEITGIQSIMNYCKNNLDLYANAEKIQKHTHKIKGLAPMVNKDDLGLLSSLLDSILKKIMKNKNSADLLEIFSISIGEMQKSMIFNNYDLDKINKRVSQISSNVY
jgi:chemotaxis protein histidine kinase CheA